jgi:FkbM family methyltransferase
MGQPIRHHPIFKEITPWSDEIPPGFVADFLGTITRHAFEKNLPSPCQDTTRTTPSNLPEFNEEYFEWVDLLESVKQAKNRYVFVELGAGYGRWAVHAAQAIKRLNPMPFDAVAVEAEPTHFEFLKQHSSDNGLEPCDHRLIRAAVWTKRGVVKFYIGNASEWYGQAIDQSKDLHSLRRSIIALMYLAFHRPGLFRASRRQRVTWVPAITLNEILYECPYVDLLDMDIQGAELDVITSSIEALNDKVRRIHIGTHNAVVEEGLRLIFSSNGWLNIWDYQCGNTEGTPYGSILFGDGVQTWVNPALKGQ